VWRVHHLPRQQRQVEGPGPQAGLLVSGCPNILAEVLGFGGLAGVLGFKGSVGGSGIVRLCSKLSEDPAGIVLDFLHPHG
jgi:hypothetical protein